MLSHLQVKNYIRIVFAEVLITSLEHEAQKFVSDFLEIMYPTEEQRRRRLQCCKLNQFGYLHAHIHSSLDSNTDSSTLAKYQAISYRVMNVL